MRNKNGFQPFFLSHLTGDILTSFLSRFHSSRPPFNTYLLPPSPTSHFRRRRRSDFLLPPTSLAPPPLLLRPPPQRRYSDPTSLAPSLIRSDLPRAVAAPIDIPRAAATPTTIVNHIGLQIRV